MGTLLDEPLSNLDAKLREKMRSELKRMQRDFGLTTVYVTHDQSEALALSHEIGVMREGGIVQVGSPRDTYERPRNKFVADFVDSTNFIDGTMLSAAAGNGRCRVATPLGELNVPCMETLAKGAPVVVSVRPEDVELCEAAPAREEDDNVCHGNSGPARPLPLLAHADRRPYPRAGGEMLGHCQGRAGCRRLARGSEKGCVFR